MENKCRRCGKCCEELTLDFSEFDLPGEETSFRIRITKNGDKEFIEKHWTIEKIGTHKIWYSCEFFNKETKRCNNYEGRPDVCKNYPIYTKSTRIPSKQLKDGCGFKVNEEETGNGKNEQLKIGFIESNKGNFS